MRSAPLSLERSLGDTRREKTLDGQGQRLAKVCEKGAPKRLVARGGVETPPLGCHGDFQT